MLQAGAIVLGATIIAAAILVTFRWEVTAGVNDAYKLDRWRGWVTVCRADSLDRANAPRFHGVQMYCGVADE